MSLRTRRIVLVLLAFGLAVAGAVFIRQGASSEASADGAAKVTEAQDGQVCPENFTVKLAGNKGQKLDDAHQAKVESLIAKYEGAELSQKVMLMQLALAKQDPRFLYMLVQGIPVLESSTDIKSIEELSKNGCYTYEGREAWKLLRGVLLSATVVATSEAPANGVNTGVNGSGVFQTAPGISGDRRAVMYTTKSGFTFWVMWRCGNLVVQHAIPGVPTVTEPPPPGGGTNPPGSNPPGSTTPQGGKVDNHPVGGPLPGGAGGPQAPNTDTTPDTEDPDGTHAGSNPVTGCHGGCTGGTPTTTRPVPPSIVEPVPTTVPATVVPTTAPGP
jgi:hypothetical protein